MRIKKTIILAVLSICVQGLAFNQSLESESKVLKTIKKHLLETIWIEFAPSPLMKDSLSNPSKIFGPFEADGSWSDINEKSKKDNQSLFEEHLSRTLQLSYFYTRNRSHNPYELEIKNIILKSLQYWIDKNPINANWWYNEIGVPNTIYRIVLLMENELPPATFKACMKILERSQIKLTGQNLLWLAQINIARGCLQNDSKTVANAFRAIQKELTDSLNEGICPDYSFHQHGHLLYSGGYGAGFALYAARLSFLAHHTMYAFPENKIAIICHFILDGEQWMIIGKAFDFSTMGREISRKKNDDGVVLEYASEYMLRQEPDCLEEMRALRKRVSQNNNPFIDFKPYGNRYYWNSDYMVHRREGYFFSVHNSSLRMLGSESINGEGLKSYHLGDGCTNLQLTGKEFDSIFPVWDWQKIPGITYIHNGQNVPRIDGYNGFKGKTSFVGGISDGEYGMAVLDFNKDSVIGHKAWFCFDHEIACLGANLQSQNGQSLYTSVNQCLLNGKVYVKSTSLRSVNEGDSILEKVIWVHHNNVLYFFPEQEVVNIINKTQKGSWHDINLGGNESQINLKIFGLYIEHTKKNSSNNYNYIIMPCVSLEKADEKVRLNAVQVIQNTAFLQAVYHRDLKILQAAFYQPTEVELPDALKIDVDHPCLLMLHQRKGEIALYLSNPENKPEDVKVSLSKNLYGENCIWDAKMKKSILSVHLPEGLKAGSTVQVSLHTITEN
jgi:chondroitin AC lyase